jgi:ferredoxin
MHDALLGELITFISRNGLADQLLGEHRCEASGKCASCRPSKYTQGPWPCTTYKAAARAAGRRVPVVAG